MLAPDKIEIIGSQLEEGDFYRRDHQAIFRAMSELNLRGQPCDAVTLGDWFAKSGLDGVVDPQYVVELANDTPSAANILAYAAIVRDKALRRRIIDNATTMLESSYGAEQESQSILDMAVAALMALQKVEAKCEFTIKDAVTMAYAKASDAMKNGGKIQGVPTGLSDVDEHLGGLHNSDLIVIGARAACGKTSFLLNLANNCGVPCGIISGEMPAVQVGSRMLSLESRVDAAKMRNGQFIEDDFPRLVIGVESLINREMYIYDKSGPTITEVIRQTRKWVKQYGIKILYLDYIQRIRAVDTDKKTARHERVAEVTQKLKDLARDLNIPIVALAQVSRDVDRREDKVPNMGDLSDSSEIEKESDVVITLCRPYVYDEQADPEEMIVSVEKNRHGGTGVVKCRWIGRYMRIEDKRHE